MNAHVTTDATESQPANPLTIVALQNEAALRALQAAGPQRTAAAVAHISGQNPKNMARQLELMARDNLVVQAEAGWTITPAGERALAAMDLARGGDPVRVGSGAQSATSADEQEAGGVGSAGQSPASAALQDSGVGSGAQGATSAAHSNDVLSLRHDQIRPNPLNLRKDGQSADIESLADSIEAAGDVLQNLVVFPADGDGIHTLSAGERRWRAVGLLIEQGRWPADRRLRAIARENTAGQTSFIALVENGQRQNLTLIEEARGYQALVEETGWSARHAAHQTGRDPRTVQEMLKVLREADPADVARHEADPRDLTWEALRDSVKAGREPVQADIEDVAGGGGALRFSREVQEAALAAAQARDPRAIAGKVSGSTTVEGETWPEEPHEIISQPWSGYPDATLRLYRSDRDRWGLVMASHTLTGGFGEAHGVWSNDTIYVSRAEALLRAATRIAGQWGADGQSRKAKAWLDALRAGQTAPAPPPASHPQPMAGAGYSAIPTPKADVPLRALNPVETLAMVELAALLQGEDAITDRDGAPMAPVHQYWLDATASELRALGLVVFVHNVQGASRPYAGMPKAGRDWIAQHYPEGVTAEVLDAVEDLVDQAGLARAPERHEMDGAPCYATPWLNLPPLTAAGAEPPEGDDSLPLETPTDDAEEDEDDAAEAQALLAEITVQLLSADDFDRAAVFRRLGITFPLRAAPAPATGLILDANGQAVFAVDQEGAFHDDAAAARVLALVAALNAAVAEDERPLDPLDLPAADKPAVPIRQSITVDAITCLEDGRTFTSLRAHLRATYGLTPDAYRLRWDLPADYPMLAPRTAQNRQDAGSRLWSW